MKKHTGKGRGISINAPNQGGTSDVNAFKMRIEAQTAAPPAVRPFVPYKPSKAMEEAIARCKELTALPSWFD